MQHFGDIIKARREAKKWTLREAAGRISVSTSRLAELERGVSYHTERPTRPTQDLVERIAGVYGLPTDYALTEAGYPPSGSARLSPDAERLLSLYEGLDADHKELAIAFLRMLLERDPRRTP